ncbi:MAG: ABC transporter ATP-binding protein [Vicinamibacteria bacterium]|nr:ABC transporter ATP-binding protein [Vicinamibacteria bacterium]
MTPRVVFKKASRWYGPVMALNDVSFELGPGVYGLLGPNGAGKSSLLKMASGQLRPSQGTVELLGRPAFGSPEVFHAVGLCSDTDAMFEDFTGLQFVSSLLSLNGFDRAQAHKLATEAIEIVDLKDAMHRRVGGYSKGMRQRIKLAQALAHQPEVLFLDEPLTGMDPQNRKRISDLMKRLGDEGRTVLVSTHILHELEQVTRRVLLIHNGRVLAEGDLGEIRDLLDRHPRSVRIKAKDTRGLARELVTLPDLVSLNLEDATQNLLAEIRKPDAFFTKVQEVSATYGVEEMWVTDENLESVFSYLVSK